MFGKGIAAAVAEKAKDTDMSTATGAGVTSDGWVRIQKQTFSNWVNVQLAQVGTSISVVEDDFKTGVPLIQILEVISGKKFKKYQKVPKTKHHSIENLANAFTFMKEEGINLVNIQAEDLNDGNLKLVLGLLWTIIYHYQIRPKFANAPAAATGAKKAGFKDLLLEWVQAKIPEQNIKNFNKDWQDGTAICALVNAIGGSPALIPEAKDMSPNDKVANCRRGIEAAKEELGVPALLAPEDMSDPAVDDLSVMTYVSYFKGAQRKGALRLAEADQCEHPHCEERKANGSQFCPRHTCSHPKCSDLTEAGSVACKAHICQHPPGCKSVIVVGKRLCKDHEEQAAAAPQPAPGSDKANPWERDPNWRKYEGPNLGGRCKICVYYSSTTSSMVIRKNTESMMRLLEREKVHLRPDFQPWIPIDIDMSKEKRDLIFEKAGTKITPMLFIDDEYIGDYDRVCELNESGELHKLLAY